MGSLTIWLVRHEDIFRFKLIASHGDDLEDMNILVQARFDFDVVEPELDV